jgi:hypothetical protein
MSDDQLARIPVRDMDGVAFGQFFIFKKISLSNSIHHLFFLIPKLVISRLVFFESYEFSHRVVKIKNIYIFLTIHAVLS